MRPAKMRVYAFTSRRVAHAMARARLLPPPATEHDARVIGGRRFSLIVCKYTPPTRRIRPPATSYLNGPCHLVYRQILCICGPDGFVSFQPPDTPPSGPFAPTPCLRFDTDQSS